MVMFGSYIKYHQPPLVGHGNNGNSAEGTLFAAAVSALEVAFPVPQI
jgi:hypothetical protein